MLENKQERQPTLVDMAAKARDKLRVPWHKLDVLVKYQTTLDNQLYTAMKALREAQEWRMKSIDVTEPNAAEIPVDAA